MEWRDSIHRTGNRHWEKRRVTGIRQRKEPKLLIYSLLPVSLSFVYLSPANVAFRLAKGSVCWLTMVWEQMQWQGSHFPTSPLFGRTFPVLFPHQRLYVLVVCAAIRICPDHSLFLHLPDTSRLRILLASKCCFDAWVFHCHALHKADLCVAALCSSKTHSFLFRQQQQL